MILDTRAAAEAIKRDLKAFLRDTLTLELSEAKTRITHARTQSARFLGYEVWACFGFSGQFASSGDACLRTGLELHGAQVS